MAGVTHCGTWYFPSNWDRETILGWGHARGWHDVQLVLHRGWNGHQFWFTLAYTKSV